MENKKDYQDYEGLRIGGKTVLYAGLYVKPAKDIKKEFIEGLWLNPESKYQIHKVVVDHNNPNDLIRKIEIMNEGLEYEIYDSDIFELTSPENVEEEIKIKSYWRKFAKKNRLEQKENEEEEGKASPGINYGQFGKIKHIPISVYSHGQKNGEIEIDYGQNVKISLAIEEIRGHVKGLLESAGKKEFEKYISVRGEDSVVYVAIAKKENIPALTGHLLSIFMRKFEKDISKKIRKRQKSGALR